MPDADLLQRILSPGALRVFFQPVCEAANRRPHYYEGLVRGPVGTTVESPEVLFEYVRRKNRSADADRACVRAILQEARHLPSDTRLGLNIHASTLALDPEFLNFLGDTAAANAIAPSRLVVEIVEHAPPWDVKGFRNGLACLRDIGARVALDDIGLGHSNYLMVLECRPEYLKIDRYFVHGCHADFYRQAVLDSVVHLARPFGAQVVAEGVEDEADLDAVRNAGIGLIQGWLLDPPRPAADFQDAGNG